MVASRETGERPAAEADKWEIFRQQKGSMTDAKWHSIQDNVFTNKLSGRKTSPLE